MNLRKLWARVPKEVRSFLHELFWDTVKILALLLALSVVHYAVHKSDGSADFKKLFSMIHESVAVATYFLLAIKSALRLLRA